MPAEYHEAYINTGYRCRGLVAADCIKTMFQWTNETANVWTHFLPVSLFVVLAVYINNTKFALLADPQAFPLSFFILGCIVLMTVSTCAHLFNCISSRARHICFYVDYLGIAVYGLTSGIAYFYYCLPFDITTSFFTRTSPVRLQLIAVFLGIIACYVSCMSRHRWHSARYVIRTLSYSLLYVFDSIPLLVRMYNGAAGNGWEPALTYHAIHMSLIVGGSIVNALKVPERFWPGSFDYVGNSHQVMHVCSAAACCFQITAIMLDMETKRYAIMSRGFPKLFDVVGPFLVLVLCNGAIVLLFSRRLYSKESSGKDS
ncbi:membrane progestin receptor gamma-A-like [Oscarella lobularis]|uniref:membrane progestin receptor gamma-A-like n=1 Tax=Oscarella lobularis TaxID=121494 RepID=UPI003313ACEB